MRVIYSYKEGMKPVYVSNTNGTRRVLLVIEDGSDYFVYYCDDHSRQSFINRIVNKFLIEIYDMTNFERIQSDEQFAYYDSWIANNYNYNAVHVDEKVDGADQGGPILWLPQEDKTPKKLILPGSY